MRRGTILLPRAQGLVPHLSSLEFRTTYTTRACILPSLFTEYACGYQLPPGGGQGPRKWCGANPPHPLPLSGTVIQSGFPFLAAHYKFPCHFLFQQLLSNPGRQSENVSLVQTSHLNMKGLGCNLLWPEVLSFSYILRSIEPNNKDEIISLALDLQNE